MITLWRFSFKLKEVRIINPTLKYWNICLRIKIRNFFSLKSFLTKYLIICIVSRDQIEFYNGKFFDGIRINLF